MSITENKVFCKIKSDLEKNRKFIEDNLIVYSEDKFEDEFSKLMRAGYIEMANINLEFLESNSWEQEISEYRFDDINEYEKWLCGV